MARVEWGGAHRELIKFMVIGVFSTVLNYGVYLGLFVFGVGYVISMVAGFLCGTVFGYQLNKRWAFLVSSGGEKLFLGYLALYTVSMACGALFLITLVELLEFDPRIANILAICLTTCINFLGLKLLVFRNTTKSS